MENQNEIVEVLQSSDVLEENEEVESVEDEEEIQAKPVKKPRSQKQIDAFAKIIELRTAKRLERKNDKEIKDEENKKALDEKIIKKAIALKKKQNKQQKILDEDDDDDDKELQKPGKSVTKKTLAVPLIAEKPKLKITFI